MRVLAYNCKVPITFFRRIKKKNAEIYGQNSSPIIIRELNSAQNLLKNAMIERFRILKDNTIQKLLPKWPMMPSECYSLGNDSGRIKTIAKHRNLCPSLFIFYTFYFLHWVFKYNVFVCIHCTPEIIMGEGYNRRGISSYFPYYICFQDILQKVRV